MEVIVIGQSSKKYSGSSAWKITIDTDILAVGSRTDSRTEEMPTVGVSQSDLFVCIVVVLRPDFLNKARCHVGIYNMQFIKICHCCLYKFYDSNCVSAVVARFH